MVFSSVYFNSFCGNLVNNENNKMFMKINRVWAMPNKNTFDIKPIKELIEKYIMMLENSSAYYPYTSIDPFANKNRIAKITNDLDTQYNTDYNLDSLEFLKIFGDKSVDLILFDPPYSPRQVSESYKKLGKSVNMQTTQASFWGNMKKEVGRIASDDCIVISFGWNSGGMGKSNGFEIEEILLVPHGGNHNDTIVTVERRVKNVHQL